MKVLATALFAVLVSSCASAPVQTGTVTSPAPDLVTGTWDFVVAGKGAPQSFSFSLTNIPAETCISGTWYQAQPLSAPKGSVSRSAYQYQSGKLEILLSSELCDAYTSFIGSVSGASFEGSHVSYGLFGGIEHGKVSGALRH
ncbi:hypothetical protein [[Pseudomonas] boreopolis]|uniref:hypothetical protein n=1 Tax=Xanthomonas boreopolis TaxID=86183 RepID=UPI003D4200E0